MPSRLRKVVKQQLGRAAMARQCAGRPGPLEPLGPRADAARNEHTTTQEQWPRRDGGERVRGGESWAAGGGAGLCAGVNAGAGVGWGGGQMGQEEREEEHGTGETWQRPALQRSSAPVPQCTSAASSRSSAVVGAPAREAKIAALGQWRRAAGAEGGTA
jgi:hypothetical protein